MLKNLLRFFNFLFFFYYYKNFTKININYKLNSFIYKDFSFDIKMLYRFLKINFFSCKISGKVK